MKVFLNHSLQVKMETITQKVNVLALSTKMTTANSTATRIHYKLDLFQSEPCLQLLQVL